MPQTYHFPIQPRVPAIGTTEIAMTAPTETRAVCAECGRPAGDYHNADCSQYPRKVER